MTDKIKVQVLTETTDWEFPGHTYFVSTETKKMIAYMKKGTDKLIRFAGKGLTFDRRNRSFTCKWRYI